MTRKLVFHALDWVSSHLWFSDIAVALLGLFIFSCILQRLTNKGPMLWPMIGIIPSLVLHINDIYDWVTKWLIKTGGTFHYRGMWMVGAYGVVTSNPSNIEYMLKTRFKYFPKGKYYRERFHDLLGDSIFNADDELWKDQRRIASSEPHASRFAKYSLHTMQDLVHQKLLHLIEKLANSGDRIDLQEVLLRFTFDNTCTVAFGADPGCLAPDLPEVPFAKGFEEATELTTFRFLAPPFIWKPMKFFGVGSQKRLKKAVLTVHDFVEQMVADRRMELSKIGTVDDRSDLLLRFMQIKNPDNQGEKIQFSYTFLRDFCISFILAGRDTSSVALAWFFWLIHKNPQVESKILCEINEILSHRNSTKEEPTDVVFTMEELKKMVYLQVALSESLRLYPSVQIDFKEALEKDVFLDGAVVEQGAQVFFCAYSMARMESIWGKDCLEFKPERWIKDGQFMSENQFKYVVFNGGPRLCVGREKVCIHADEDGVKVVEGHNVVPKITTTLHMKDGLLVTFKSKVEAKPGRHYLKSGFNGA
ncbi:hypothetical protein L1049_020101 [Liquidambar formosana]|uniref:Cytochrome P450 n=1 Tax=Liquidambar formosana TaxID=63359 RepID=A0AAP0SC99_LIQFO